MEPKPPVVEDVPKHCKSCKSGNVMLVVARSPKEDDKWHVECLKCGAEGAPFCTATGAVDLWNDPEQPEADPLKPCPVCGHYALVKEHEGWFVACPACIIQTAKYGRAKPARAAWNKLKRADSRVREAYVECADMIESYGECFTPEAAATRIRDHAKRVLGDSE